MVPETHREIPPTGPVDASERRWLEEGNDSRRPADRPRKKMENASQLYTRMSTAQHALEALRKDVSEELVARQVACDATSSELPRFQELHSRLSTALAALHGEVREH